MSKDEDHGLAPFVTAGILPTCVLSFTIHRQEIPAFPEMERTAD